MGLFSRVASLIGRGSAGPAYGEVATTHDGRDITLGYVDPMALLQPGDELLRYAGPLAYQTYRQVLSDPQVMTTLAQRRLGVVATEWEVQAGGTRRADRAAADYLREMLDNIRFDGAIEKMHYGIFYGFGVGEIMPVKDGRTVALDAIKVRNRSRFGWALPDREPQTMTLDGRRYLSDPSGLRLLTQAHPDGERVPACKFWTFGAGADHDDDPYGLGLAHWLYWFTLFKRTGIKFWLLAAEKFASPTAMGSFSPGTPPPERTRLLQTLRAIQMDSGIIKPEGMTIDLLEAKRSGSAEYEALCRYMDGMIAKVCLLQVMTSEAVGGQYKAEVQDQAKDDAIKADCDLICASFNDGPARWLTAWNWPSARPPRVWRVTEGEDLTRRAERERVVFDMGYRPTLRHVTETYGGEWEPVTSTPPPEKKGVSSAENGISSGEKGVSGGDGEASFGEGDPAPDQAALDAALAGIEAEALDRQAQALIGPVLAHLERDPRGDPAGWYARLDDERLVTELARVLFVAHLWGRLSVQEEARDAAADFAEPADLGYAFGLAPQAAVEYFRAKGNALSWNWWEVWQESHSRAFTVAKVARLEVLKTIREAVDRILAEGITERTFIEQLRPRLQDQGWWGRKVVVDTAGGAEVVQEGSVRRLRTLYRVNAQTAYMAGRYRQQMDDADQRPYWQYVAVLDDRTRPAHRALAGKVYRHDDPIWHSHYPPNGWNCRCRVRTLSDRRLRAEGLEVGSSEGQLSERLQYVGTDRRTGEVVERTGTAWRDPVTGLELIPDPGWSYNPGAAAPWTDIALWDKARQNLPSAAAAQALEEVATHPARLGAFDAWVREVIAQEGSRGRQWVIGYLSQLAVAALGERGISVANGAIVLDDRLLVGPKARRHEQAGNALTPEEWMQVPRQLVEPEAVLFDKVNQTLLYVLPSADERKTKVVVEAGRIEKKRPAHESVRTAFKVQASDLRGAQYELIEGELKG